MKNMILATPELSDAATLTGTSSSGSLGINNLKTMEPKEVYRAMGSDVFVQADLGAAKLIDTFAIIGHSGSSRSYARVVASNTEAGLSDPSPSYDSGLKPFRSHQSGYDAAWALTVPDEQQFALNKNIFLLFLDAAVSFRYWKITISDPLATYVDMARLYIADAFQPKTNMSYGFSEGIVDPSRKTKTKTGVPKSVELPIYRVANATLDYGSEDELYGGLYPIQIKKGRTKDVLFVSDPDNRKYLQYKSYYGTFESLQPIVSRNFSIYSINITIEEMPA